MKRKSETVSLNKISEEEIVYPRKISIELYNWVVPENEIFVKIEGVYEDRIFMIGVWCLERNEDRYHNEEPYSWCYRNFLSKSNLTDEESCIMEEFKMFLKERGYPKIWYWKDDLNIWRGAEVRLSMDNLKCKWVDLSMIFLLEPVLVRGVFKLDLNEIARVMYSNKMIRTVLYISEGKNVCDIYERFPEGWKHNDICEIENCNKSFVSVVQEILGYLRRYHR